MCYTKKRVTVKIFNRTGGKIMADMKLHVEMLNGLSEDVRACVEQARERVDTYEQEISNVSSEQVASKAEKKSIKQSFSLKRWIRSKFFGISAEEARQVADSYGKYATVVDQIADENRRMEDAKMSLSTAVDDLNYAEAVQEEVDKLSGMLGRLAK